MCFVFLHLQEDRDLVARLRPFARFSDPKEHDELIDNLLVAKKIRYDTMRYDTMRYDTVQYGTVRCRIRYKMRCGTLRHGKVRYEMILQIVFV